MTDEGLSAKKQGLADKFRTVKLLSFLVSFIVIFLCFSGLGAFNQTLATTYYIDATGGNDGNTGTATNQAWKTLNNVNWTGLLQPGDSLLFKRGEVLRDSLYITWSGTSGNPITFADYGSGDLPVINGQDIIASGSWTGPDGNGVYSYTGDSSTDGHANVFTEDGAYLTYASDSTLSDGNWHLDVVSGITVTIYYRPTSGTPANHTTEWTSRAYCLCGWAGNGAYITIRNLKFFNCPFAITIGSNATKTVQDVTIENVQIDHTPLAAISMVGESGHGLNNITLSNNTINNANEGIFVGTVSSGSQKNTDIVIENNSITNTGYMTGSQSWPIVTQDEEGIGVQNIVDSNITSNEITGGAMSGITFWVNENTIGAISNQITKNYIHNILGTGISLTAGTVQGSSNQSALIANNIIENCGQDGSPPYVEGYGGLFLSGSESEFTEIYNNTIANCDLGVHFLSTAENYKLKNNIVSQNTGYLAYREVNNLSSSVLDYNLYYTDGDANFFYINSQEDFAGWVTGTGQESHSLNSNPYFVAGGDAKPYPYFYPRSYSPVINAGTDVGLTTDYLGAYVPQGAAPDIGAFEYTVSIPENIWFFFPLFLALPRLIFTLQNRKGRRYFFSLIKDHQYQTVLQELYLPYLNLFSYLTKRIDK